MMGQTDGQVSRQMDGCVHNIPITKAVGMNLFLIFSQKIGSDISKETVGMKYQSLFSGKNKKKYHQFVVC